MSTKLERAGNDPAIRSRCLGHWIGDQRADAAFDLALVWFRTNGHEGLASCDRGRELCRRSVEIRGRNDGVSGSDPLEWFEVCQFVVDEFCRWLREPENVVEVP